MHEPTELQDHLPERRTETSVLLQMVSSMHQDIKESHEAIKALDSRLTRHMNDETLELATEVAKMMSAAFPEGDPTGHRKIHEADIERAKSKAAFWKKMAEEIIKYGLIGFLSWMCFAVWAAFLKGPMK